MSQNQQLDKIISIEEKWARLRKLAGERQLSAAEMRSLETLETQVAGTVQYITGEAIGFSGAVLPDFLDM